MFPPNVIRLPYQNNESYVVGEVFEGGMGKVFKLYPVATDEPVVAMKTIKGASSIELFDTECEAWLSIAFHPNVAKAFAFGTWEGMPSVLVKWYPSSLDKIAPESLMYENLLKLIAGTVSALQFAFDFKGLIHQDIKPANILVDDHLNPILSDFGLAKCVQLEAGLKRDNPFNFNSKQNSSISGTPYFMAPELWSDTPPSVVTDIFSLGVTFYNLITNEHPYVDLTDGNRQIHEVFRKEKLEKCLSNFARSEKDLVVKIIGKCLDLEPTNRYSSYEEMLLDIGAPASSIIDQSWTVERSRSVISVADFYLEKGSTSKAKQIIESVLDRRPSDVLLISALAKIQAATGQAEEAEIHNKIAFDNLRASKGYYLSEFLPKPAFDWARNLLERKNYVAASAVIKEVCKWEKVASTSQSTSLFDSAKYSELGWYHLYHGDYEKACDYLIRYSQRCELDKPAAIWIVEAAWLCGQLKSYADEIADKVLKLKPSVLGEYGGEIEFVWSRVVLGQYANKDLKSKLWSSTPSYLFQETSNLEKEFSCKPGSLLMPLTKELQVPFIVCMDKLTTGGAYLESIQ
jgi:serine/threonine protein kinase